MNLEFTHLELFFLQALALLAAACVFVPVFKKLGLGSVLGYLVAGVSINLFFSGKFSEHPEELLHFSEFGVVLFLFVIGLELNPSTLWKMRKDIFGLGLFQVLGTGVVITFIALLLKFSWQASLVIGLGMALSSTAIVMSNLDESGQRMSAHGRKAFGILLFQDLAIVPLLLIVTLLTPTGGEITLNALLTNTFIAVTAILILILIGKFLLDPFFRWLAKGNSSEIMTTSALTIVIASAMLMDIAGMSYAMGAFIAGVMLAESQYRHELEANIEPFRALFLGLFFMAVGLSVDMQIVKDQWLTIILAAPVIMLIKALILYILARMTKNCHNTSIQTALSLSQLGEFGFVIFAAAASAMILGADQASLLIAIVSMSMALSPFFNKASKFFIHIDEEMNIEENFDDAKGKVLIIGFGRFAQIISQPLFASGLSITILDNSAARIQEAKEFGFRVHYGDGSRLEILRTAGVNNVEAVIVASGNSEITTKIVKIIQKENPNTKIFARAYDRNHLMEVYKLNIAYSIRETFESALQLGKETLKGLGVSTEKATAIVDDVRIRDRKRLIKQAKGDRFSGIELLINSPSPKSDDTYKQ